MNDSESIIHTFYSAFKNRDAETMARCYHSEAEFSDPVFLRLKGSEIGEMWKMLVSTGKDTKIRFSNIVGSGDKASCDWEADYNFSRTGRFVENRIRAEFELKDGLIYRHIDSFDLRRWCAMAFGPLGKLIGWTSLFQNKLRSTARGALEAWIRKKKPKA